MEVIWKYFVGVFQDWFSPVSELFLPHSIQRLHPNLLSMGWALKQSGVVEENHRTELREWFSSGSKFRNWEKGENNFSWFHKTLFSIYRLPARIYDRFPTDFSPEFFSFLRDYNNTCVVKILDQMSINIVFWLDNDWVTKSISNTC